MDIGVQIKTLLSEAELYRTQGLFSDAKEKYQAAASTIRKIDRLKNKENLLQTISGKIKSLEEFTQKVTRGPASPELSEKGQDLIKNLFGKNELEKAVALIKFGQIERAVAELTPLLDLDEYRLSAGKHILQCKVLNETTEDAIDQYNKWFSADLFTADQLASLREHLHTALMKEGVMVDLPGASDKGDVAIPMDDSENGDIFTFESEEEILDITSIGVHFTSGPQKGNMVEFDVNFQSGDMLSLIVSKTDEALIEDFNKGGKLSDVQFYSPIAMFNGTAIVVNKTKIETGPKQGDYCLDLKVTST